jgi:D-aspartate ligase
MNILLLDGHTVQVLPMLEYLNKKNHITIFAEEKLSFGWASKYPNKKILCPKLIENEEKYISFLKDYLSNNSIDIIVPLFNDSAELMSKIKSSIEAEFKTKIAIPHYETLIKGHDKNLTMKIAKDINIPHPKTFDLEDGTLEAAAEYCGFPSLIKPNIGAGAKGITRVNSLEELKNEYPSIKNDFGNCTLQEFISQEGFQYKCQLFRDKDGLIKGQTVQKKYRYFPISGGSTSCSEIVLIPEIIEYSNKFLNEVNWRGFADFDYIHDINDNKYKLMEINPRLPASIKSSFKAGVDFSDLIINDAIDNNTTMYKSENGIWLRYLSLEVLWFIFSKNKDRFNSKPNWFNFFNSKTYYIDGSLQDPLPMITGFLIGIKKYLNPSFRKAKLKNKGK